MKKIIVIILILLFNKIHAQNIKDRIKIVEQTNLSELQQLSKKYIKRNKKLSKKSSGFKKTIINSKGNIGYLSGVNSKGLPEYDFDDNLNAALTSRVTKLWSGGESGLNLSGKGVEIGHWEAGGRAKSNHQELQGRITNAESSPRTSHATHTAGTMIASGVNSEAKGMAPLATIVSRMSDNDSVLDENDNCNTTPLNTKVDINGCAVFSLPFNNFTIEVKGETCRSSNNGTITITTTENHNYTATASVNGELVTQTFLNSTSFQNLEAGTYLICITIEDEPDYESCFTTQVTKPDNLKVLSKVNLKSKIISLYLKGGDTYSIVLNNELIQITTNNLDLNLKPGINKLKITTNTACQGVYNELIELPFEDIRLFPNPIKQGENFYISTGGINTSEIEVSIYSTLGSLITSNNYKNIAKSNLKIDVTNLPKGLYMVKLSSLEITKSYTIIIE